MGILLIPVGLAFFIEKVPLNIQPGLEKTVSINKEQTVKQSFYVDQNNLSGVGLSIKNPNLMNKKDLYLEILEDEAVIRKVTVSGYSIGDGNFINFEFDPITNSANKEYSFLLSSPQTEVSESFSVYASEKDEKYNRGLLVNNEVQRGTSSFVIFTKSINPLNIVLSIYLDLVDRLFKDLVFAFFYLGVIGLLAVYLIINFKPLRRS